MLLSGIAMGVHNSDADSDDTWLTSVIQQLRCKPMHTHLCPPMGKALWPVALGLFPLSGMYQGINHPLVGSIVKINI